MLFGCKGETSKLRTNCVALSWASRCHRPGRTGAGSRVGGLISGRLAGVLTPISASRSAAHAYPACGMGHPIEGALVEKLRASHGT
jgi:hypothetical protein